mgnify:CR=1 FL=1
MGDIDDEIWLSICIPTYNRPLQLERMLKKLIPQISAGIEIVIRDDSETEESRVLIDKLFSEQCINYRYFSGSRIGVDSAAIFLLEKSIGKYIWWFSDDDEMTPNVITEIKEIVLKSDYEVVWANFSYNQYGSLAVNRPSGPFDSPDEALRVLGTNVGLISTQIIRRKTGLRAIDFAKKHIHGISFASTAIFLKSLGGVGGGYFIRGPAIKCNPTEIEEIIKITSKDGEIINNGFKVYGEYFRELVVDLPDAYSKSAKRYAISINFSSLWRGMLVGWVGGWDTPRGKRLKMLKLYWSFPECWIALTLFCLPRPVVSSFYKMYKIFFSHRKFIFIDRLRGFWHK